MKKWDNYTIFVVNQIPRSLHISYIKDDHKSTKSDSETEKKVLNFVSVSLHRASMPLIPSELFVVLELLRS